jgi:hypothetical protein
MRRDDPWPNKQCAPSRLVYSRTHRCLDGLRDLSYDAIAANALRLSTLGSRGPSISSAGIASSSRTYSPGRPLLPSFRSKPWLNPLPPFRSISPRPERPKPVTADGRSHLLYELHLTNLSASPIELLGLYVLGADGDTPLASYLGEALEKAAGRRWAQ